MVQPESIGDDELRLWGLSPGSAKARRRRGVHTARAYRQRDEQAAPG